MATGDDLDDRPITGINVTPLVDVTLVLLITFFVTAQLIVARAIAVDPPKAVHANDVALAPLVVTIDEAGTIRVEGRAVNRDELVSIAASLRSRDHGAKAVIRAAEATTHGSVIGAMDALRSAGIEKIAFAIRPP